MPNNLDEIRERAFEGGDRFKRSPSKFTRGAAVYVLRVCVFHGVCMEKIYLSMEEMILDKHRVNIISSNVNGSEHIYIYPLGKINIILIDF